MGKSNNSKTNPYGSGEHPPYSLYESADGKWGLIDGTGNRLPAIFERHDDRFSTAPWEVVTFDETEGFEILAWYDPHEVWFNFTFDNPAYPEEFTGYLWRDSKKDVADYTDIIYELIPSEHHWLIDAIMEVDHLDEMEDEDFYWHIDALLCSHPEFADAAVTNQMLDPIMRNKDIDPDIPHALWKAKVKLDNSINIYKEDYPDGM